MVLRAPVLKIDGISGKIEIKLKFCTESSMAMAVLAIPVALAMY